MEKKIDFPGISPSAWEHPADAAALSAFTAMPFAADLVRRVIGSTTERSLRLGCLANSARVTASQFPGLHASFVEAAARLDICPLPELFVQLDPNPGAWTLGVERPFILLSSASLELWDAQEILAILGHELGHVLSGHAVYKTLLAFVLKLSSGIAGSLPLGGAALGAAAAALKEWDRKSELSADRASLLVVQDAPLVYRCLMKSAGGPQVAQMDMNEFFRQAKDYEEGEGILDSIYKIMDVIGESHPFPVVRMTSLQEWEKGGKYESILAGDYPRRGAAGERDPERDFERARSSYAQDFGASGDPLAQAAKKVMDDIGGFFGGTAQAPRGERGEGEGGKDKGPPRSIEDVIDELFGNKN
jgi:Zn-dependent protease with chaperone function